MIIPDNMITHIAKIFNGEYDIGYNNANPVILDIGANIGGFARWANYKWPNSKIYCYEPVKSTFEMLKSNTFDIPNMEINNVAIGKKKEKKKIYYGKNNIGEASLIQGEEQREEGETINVFPGSKLPEANIVKIDTEGYEVEILNAITFQPDIYLIEYHSADNRRFIDSYLSDYVLLELEMTNYNYGIAKYAKKSLLTGS
jgi:FkbM family methyltransferase